MNFREQLIELLKKHTSLSKEEITLLLTVPPDEKLGDYAFPCFKLGKNPPEEAEKLKNKLPETSFLLKTEVSGPYLNFFLHPTILAETTLPQIQKEKKKYGSSTEGKNKTIVIDFSSPNIAKPFGIGHLRSTVIGNSLYKTYRFLGYKTIGINHLGDWGTQFGKLIIAYQKWGNKQELEQDPIKYLLSLYVKFHQESTAHPELEEQARTEFKNLEDGTPSSLALWETFKSLSLEEFKRIYRLLNVKFDSYNGEAFYNDKTESTIKKIQSKIKTEMSDGALIINLEQYKLPPVLLRKSNESTTYHTRDLAAALYRIEHYKPVKILYVVGSEQKMHFQQLFKTLELYGLPSSTFEHIDFGLFLFPEGKMSTRKGKIIFLEEVLDKAINVAEEIIKEKNPHLKNKQEIAKIIGIGAIIFADLSNDRIRNIEFDWKRMLSFDGETAPYIQYTHARSCSILRKAKKEYNLSISPKINFELLNHTSEQTLIKQLYNFPETLHKVIQHNKPHILANYLIKLAQTFNDFYHHCPVLTDDKTLAKSRLLLVNSTRQVLENGLNLLGITAPVKM
ncbi:arginine--tRNA ligase [Candidatus Woesearchaeota archaeon]|nr:arginine--tRNA ligase [Candidatus Woesearchaeota archaeon]